MLNKLEHNAGSHRSASLQRCLWPSDPVRIDINGEKLQYSAPDKVRYCGDLVPVGMQKEKNSATVIEENFT